MQKFKLGFRNKSVAERIQISAHFARSVAQLPSHKRRYVNLAALESDVVAATQSVEHVAVAEAALRAALTARNEAMQRLCGRVTHSANGIQCSAERDTDLIVAGLNLAKKWASRSAPEAPAALRLVYGAPVVDGTVLLRWKHPMRRCIFIIEATSDPNATKGWKTVATTHRRSHRVEKGASNRVLWFRVSAKNSRGQSGYAGPIAVS
jgi:hypothetical protein